MFEGVKNGGIWGPAGIAGVLFVGSVVGVTVVTTVNGWAIILELLMTGVFVGITVIVGVTGTWVVTAVVGDVVGMEVLSVGVGRIVSGRDAVGVGVSVCG